MYRWRDDKPGPWAAKLFGPISSKNAETPGKLNDQNNKHEESSFTNIDKI
jgi:hypothetical protein